MPKAATNIVKFPTRRIVRRHRFMQHLEDSGASPDRIAIDAAIYSVTHAIAALNRQRSSLYMLLHRAARIDAGERPEDIVGTGF